MCINKKNGLQLWKTKLKSATITKVYFEDKDVFAYSGGHLYCLVAENAEIVWDNPSKGFGYGTCIIASEHQNPAVIASQLATQQALAATTVVSSGATPSNS